MNTIMLFIGMRTVDDISESDFDDAFRSCTSYRQIYKMLGFSGENAKKRIRERALLKGISPHKKYEVKKRICPVCQTEFFTKVGHKDEKVTCSRKCSVQHFHVGKKKSDVEKARISDAMRKYYGSVERVIRTKSCLERGKNFEINVNKNRRYCSQQCAAKANWKNPEYRKNVIDRLTHVRKKMIKDGTWNVWRKNAGPSYPEKYFMEVLASRCISYEYNRPFGNYNIDFAICDKMIALEIDGQQHLVERQRQSDRKKDASLSSAGWTVYRIPWSSPCTPIGKARLMKSIEDFLSFYESFSGR